MSLLTKAGITKLSELDIDTTKDWQGYGISNIGTVVVTDGAGHYLELPSLTTAQRDALTPATGMTIWNSDNTQVERYNGASWAGIGIAGIAVRMNSGGVIGTRPQLNFHQGAGINLEVADDAADKEVDITIIERFKDKFFTLLPEDAALHSTGGAARVTVDGTNFSYVTLDFDKATEEVASWENFLSPNYLDENITVKIFWKTSVNVNNCKWGIKVGGRQEDEAWDAALGPEKTVVTAAPAVIGDVAISETAPIVPGWSPSDIVVIRLARKAADGEDTLDADVQVLKVVVSYTSKVPLAQAFYGLDETDVSPTKDGTWRDVDVSGSVPVGATGAILHIMNSTSAGSWAVRKKGSTDDHYYSLAGYCHCWAIIGVDDNRVFQAKLGTATVIYLVGYTAQGVYCFENAIDKSLTAIGAWTTIDLSAECPAAIGIIIEVVNTIGFARDYGLRKYGSTDAFIEEITNNNHVWALIGCDEVQKIEGYIQTTDVDFYVIGYVTSGAQFYTNAHDQSLSVFGEWADLPETLHDQAAMGFIEILRDTGKMGEFDLRKKGAADETYKQAIAHCFAFVECDADKKIEGKAATDGVLFKMVGFGTKV